jgi:hypothetical protein
MTYLQGKCSYRRTEWGSPQGSGFKVQGLTFRVYAHTEVTDARTGSLLIQTQGLGWAFDVGRQMLVLKTPLPLMAAARMAASSVRIAAQGRTNHIMPRHRVPRHMVPRHPSPMPRHVMPIHSGNEGVNVVGYVAR